MTDELRPITEVELQMMRDALERLRTVAASPEEHACLAAMAEEIEFFAELRVMVSDYDGDGDEVLDASFYEEARRRARVRKRGRG
jgi:hypothetical protein